MAIYTKPVEEVYKTFSSSETGLTSTEAATRLAKNGKNQLAAKKKKSIFVKFIEQFKDVMILVLIAAALISAGIAIFNNAPSELIDSAVIMIIVIVNAIVGLIQENKAESAIEALQNMNKPFCKVIRDGKTIKIRSEEVVVGDIVVLESGDIVPADLRLTFSTSLKIEESALTGESVPCEKDFSVLPEENAPLGDRSNMAYSGGTVAYGRGQGIVVATGMATEVGKIAKMLSDGNDSATPLQKQINKTAKVLSVVILIAAAIIFVCSLLKSTAINGNVIIHSFMTAVAIAVAAIPEGLPAVVTVVLALGVQKMSKKNALIRNLPSVETLGCCEIICSDKTGTLTLNKMTVKKLFTLSGGEISAEEYSNEKDRELLTVAMTLCNDTVETDGILTGDPTETALVDFAISKGFSLTDLKNEWVRIDELPFDSVRKTMTTVNKNGNDAVAYVKGATDVLIDKCTLIYDNGKVRNVTDDDKKKIKAANENMAKNALRVLSVAVKYDDLDDKETLESNLVFVGLVGMIDPPRPEVKQAVATCVKAGIRPIMITGDHSVTAAAIAKEIGILKKDDKVMLGSEIDKLTDEEFVKVIQEYSVFARVSPENKVRIVKAYKSLNKVVAMTGDGVNDAPSIKQADIGIGMGITGTDVSKGAADMILADDNFATIVNAVEEGRKIFANIKKAIQFLLSANTAEVLCLFIATVFLLKPGQEFLTPVMILWVNLVTDSFPALSLGVEAAESDVMNYPPRNSQRNLFAGKTGLNIIIQGLMQTALVMLAYCLGDYACGTHEEAMTMTFITLCFIQLFHSYNMRSEYHSILNKKLFANKWLNFSFIIGVALVLMVTLIPPIAELFACEQLSILEWLIAIACSAMIVPFVEIQKAIERKVMKNGLQK